jgi:3-hydroxyacyl-[acyl-carrier-protein] dehydratase
LKNYMLLGSFYQIEKYSTEGTVELYEIKFNPEHAIFKGHFPDRPITPGVIEMEIVKQLLEKSTSKKLSLVKVRNCKFLNILNPEEDTVVGVSIMYSEKEGSAIESEASIQNESKGFLKLKAEYQAV